MAKQEKPKAKKEDKKPEGKEFTLKLKRPHPKNVMKLGRHAVTHLPQKFYLNEDEEKELSQKGPAHWIKQVEK